MSNTAHEPAPITGKRIAITGVTGWVAGPVAASLAAQGNTVFGVARFRTQSVHVHRFVMRGRVSVFVRL